MRTRRIRAGGLAAALGAVGAVAAPPIAAPSYTIRAEIVWRVELENAGKCSPRLADLNADGHEDVVLGRGVEGRWGEVVALDGRSGRVLWSRRMTDEVLTALPLLDVDGDRIPDVFLGGRKDLHDVFALSGKDGTTIWRLVEANPQTTFPPINFINLLLVDDRDGDGLGDLLIVQSGGLDERRLAARFFCVRSADGSLLASGVAPDGKESYSIPLFEQRPGAPPRLWVGTGGETLSGNLLRLGWPGLEEQWRVRSIGGGFIGSPVLADLDRDGRDEVVAAGMNGAVYRIDADSGEIRWRWRERPYWTYVSPALGAFDDEPTLDVVAGFNRGVWPRRDGARLVWLDGRTGKPISEVRLEGPSRSTASSPLVLDVDHDGRDETLIVLGNPVPESTPVTDETHRLVLFDGGSGRDEVLDLEFPGYSIATPRLADLDGDRRLDLIHASHFEVMRIELTVAGPQAEGEPRMPRIEWGEMRGPGGAGIYRPGPVPAAPSSPPPSR